MASGSSRHHARRTDAAWKPEPGGARLASPLVGVFRPALGVGAVVTAGTALGMIELLGQEVAVHAPAGTRGVITAVAGNGRARAPVDHGAALYTVDPDAAAVAGSAGGASATAGATTAGGLVFVAPTSGRFYGKPGPGKPPFVTVGAVITDGQTVCMLEVMKTFNRVTYGGPGLPSPATVAEILVADESDVDAGTPLLRVT